MDKNIIITIDTREKKNQHLTKFWDKQNIKYRIEKLNVGDYSFEFNKINYENKIVIERKNSLDELCQNFTKNRERFRREFLRAEDRFVFLLIENAAIKDIYNHNYRSKMHPNALAGSIKSWREKYNIYVLFSKKLEAGPKILEIFNRYLKSVKQQIKEG